MLAALMTATHSNRNTAVSATDLRSKRQRYGEFGSFCQTKLNFDAKPNGTLIAILDGDVIVPAGAAGTN
jgi:hypothetical protein